MEKLIPGRLLLKIIPKTIINNYVYLKQVITF